jgi:hypothetical protein
MHIEKRKAYSYVCVCVLILQKGKKTHSGKKSEGGEGTIIRFFASFLVAQLIYFDWV